MIFLNPFSLRAMVDISFGEDGAMAKYKPYNYSQRVMIPISLGDQLMPGTLEFAIHTLVEDHVRMSVFEDRYNNDETGRWAYDPKVLLKVVLFAYSRGLISSRKMEQACQRILRCLHDNIGQLLGPMSGALYFVEEHRIRRRVDKVSNIVDGICQQSDILPIEWGNNGAM